MLKILNWLQGNQSGAAVPQNASGNDALYAPVITHVISQFDRAGLLGQVDDAQNWAVDKIFFCDAYLQGILHGLCQSLEVRNPQLEGKTDGVFEKLITKLAGAGTVKEIMKISENLMMMHEEEYLRGMHEGYSEGLTIQSLQKHDLVLL